MGEVVEGGSLDEEPALDLEIISSDGELILAVGDEARGGVFRYRARLECLRQTSSYFERLLHPDKFGEGARISEVLPRLRNRYANLADAPVSELPCVNIPEVGKISKVNSIKHLIADFLLALHGLDLSMPFPPLANLANLAVVADRFDTLPYFSEYAWKRGFIRAIDGKSKAKGHVQSEERIRQKLLVGLLLDHKPWIAPCSKQLIIHGSVCWRPNGEPAADAALWWDLPRGLEDEMATRRDYVLETIESLQTRFLELYSSNERQCRLGYDSSLQCDSFQLGEMVRFFTRAGLLRWDGTLQGKEASYPYDRNIEQLLDALRQCPSYQIDRNHAHCGLRTKLIPILDAVEPFLRLDSKATEVGVCGHCWSALRSRYAWSAAKRPFAWTRGSLQGASGRLHPTAGGEACLAAHLRIRDLFMATSREWTAQDSDGFATDNRITLGYRKV